MRIFHRHVYLSISALFIAISASAQEGGKDANSLNAKFDAVFAQYDKADSPGCALGVIEDGKLLYARGYGMANLEHNTPNSPKLVYDIGSTSKQFAAASILLLAQQGKLSLDDDARKHIPELPAYQKPITIRHLLHHTSGLRDYLTLFSLAGMNFDDTTTEKLEEGKLFVIDRNGVKRPLAPTVRDSFAVISGPQFEFSRDAAGKVSGFAVHAGRIRNVRFSK